MLSIDQIKTKAQSWLGSEFNDETRKEVKEMLANDEKKLIDAFYQDLEFGTGGLRGIMGAGTNRMNIYTLGMATQGLSNYIIKQCGDKGIRVAIAYDCRNNSRYFAETTANIFSANGFEVFLFESLRPTPELSFAIRHYKCQSGVVITASHNPPEYNGYKAYWNDGSQLVAPHDENVIEEVQKVRVENTGVLLASGLIAGEALMGLAIAIFAVFNIFLYNYFSFFKEPTFYISFIVLAIIAYVLIQIPLKNAGKPDEPAPPASGM